MKRIFLMMTLVIAGHYLVAQSDVENKLKEQMWKNASAEFKTTTVPDKWKNESAVVLALEREYIGDFATKMTGLNVNRMYVEKLNIHFRIKLLDKAAITDFSELSFDDKTVRTNMFGRSSAYRVIGIKVIKATGGEKEVDLSTAVKADVTSNKELKIPIPNLEVGDIIDYYVAFKDERLQMPDFGDEILFQGKYPIVSYIVKFKIPHEFELYSTPYNGAPDFKKETVKNDLIYTLKKEMQEKDPDVLWNYEYRTGSHIRYRIDTKGGKPNAKKDAEKMLEAFNYPNAIDVGYMEDYLNVNMKKDRDTKNLVNEIYYLLRNPIYKQAYFEIDQSDPLNYYYTPNKFYLLLDRILDRKKIDFEVILAPSRAYGPVPSLTSFSVCDFVVKVKTTPPIYLERPSPFSIPNDVPYMLEGMEGVSSDIQIAYKPIPVSTYEQNSTATTINASFTANDFSKLAVKRKVIAKGHTKISHQYSVFTNYDYLKEYDQPKYLAESSRVMGGLIKEYKKEKTKFEQRKAQDYNERDERLKEQIERDMDTKPADYSLTVKNIGMWDTAPDTEYEDSFTLENMGKKAGPNIIFEIGKFIGKQTEVEEKQKERSVDIYMDYPRMFTQEIVFTVPAGYSVEGIESLNKTVESDAGGFISTAQLSGSTLTIKTKKYYTKNTYPAADWPKITAFLNAAVDFYGAKILLKKK
jgi:hypothetical protein